MRQLLPEVPGQDRGGVPRPDPRRHPRDATAARDDPALGEPRGERRGPARAALRAPARLSCPTCGRGAPPQATRPTPSRSWTAATSRACIRSSCGCSTTCARIRTRALRTGSARAPTSARRSTAGSSGRAAQVRRTSASRNLLELGAFREIQRGWERLGYPFASLDALVASAVGASGDRPAALAELMGIVVNDGAALSDRHAWTRCDLAAGHTLRDAAEPCGRGGPAGTGARDRGGRARRPRRCGGAGHGAGAARLLWRDGKGARVGGKTGTGDHRFETMGRGRRVIESRASTARPPSSSRSTTGSLAISLPTSRAPKPPATNSRAPCLYGSSASCSRLWRRFSTRQADADRAHPLRWRPRRGRSTYREYASRPGFGRRLAAGPFCRPSPLGARHAWARCRLLVPSALGRPIQSIDIGGSVGAGRLRVGL